MANAKILLFNSTILLLAQITIAMIDYCGNHTFANSKNTKDLHFSKENSDEEFGIYDKLKCLHCCSRGYRSIEWFKDGLPYPWPANISNLIIYPESHNQTIYSQQLTLSDAGKYWCIVRNSTHSLQHVVSLTVSGPSISLEYPKTMYRPRDQIAAKGEFVRFYCEAFVGTIDLPDYQSEITWERFDLNRSFINKQRIFQETIFREEKRVLGSYLIFTSVEHEDYGKYTCKVKNLGDQVIQLETWLKFKDANHEEIFIYKPRERGFQVQNLFVVLLALTALLLLTTCLHVGKTGGFLKRLNSSSARGERKNFLIVYHQTETEEVLNRIVPVLSRHHYGYAFHPLHSKSQLGEEELNAKADSYQGLIVLMTSVFLGGVWSAKNIKSTIESLLKIHFTVICIFAQGLPVLKEGDRDSRSLLNSLRKIRYAERLQEKDLKMSTHSANGNFPLDKSGSITLGSLQKLI